MKNSYLITGYPGFIAHYLILQLLSDYPQDTKGIYLLVLPSMKEKANQSLMYLCQKNGIDQAFFTLIEGDITKSELALNQSIRHCLEQQVTHVYHLAAIYDLAVPEDIAYKVNVVGTQNINKLVLSLSKLQRYTYFSTAYVSGKREGVILEDELDVQQTFKNHYERTKFEAEKLVREMITKVPTTIIRPGVVHGHSITGETTKFDGPYMMLNFFERMKHLYFIPYLGNGEVEGNFVPVDYVTQATVYLSHQEKGIGKTYHLTHPSPYTMRHMYRLMAEAYLDRSPSYTLPLKVVRFFLSLALLRRFFKVEREALDYFVVTAHYDTTAVKRDLQGSGISCPEISFYIKAIVQYYKDNKHHKDKHINIS